MERTFDLIVIGSGPGGHSVALNSALLGAKVALIEKGDWGGTCTNRGCVPTKALLACSRSYSRLGSMRRLGIYCDYSRFDFSAIKKHQLTTVKIAGLGVQKSLRDAGVELFSGKASIVSPGKVRIDDSELVRGKKIVIAWGSKPFIPAKFPRSSRVLSSDDLLSMADLPGTVNIVGGGAIGVEFATLLSELGCKVKLIEMMEQILPYDDPDAAGFLQKELNKIGVEIFTSTSLQKIEETSNTVKISLLREGAALNLDAEFTLLAMGRSPLVEQEELEQLGIKYSGRGIAVDSAMKTTAENIYAVGDVTGGTLLAHRAARQGKFVANLLFGASEEGYSEENMPYIAYSHPAVARVGLTERESMQRGLDIETVRHEYGANMMARAELLGNGFVKLIFLGDVLKGATVCGELAGELIASLSLAVSSRLGKKELKKWVIGHPTLSEILSI